MIRGTLNSLAFAVGCAIALAAVPMHAQTLDTQSLTNAQRLNPEERADWRADRNSAESGQYERRLGRNEADLQYRMQRECGSIANAHLRTGCMDSLALPEDMRARGLSDGLTGGDDGRINPIDRTFQGPEKYDPHLGR